MIVGLSLAIAGVAIVVVLVLWRRRRRRRELALGGFLEYVAMLAVVSTLVSNPERTKRFLESLADSLPRLPR